MEVKREIDGYRYRTYRDRGLPADRRASNRSPFPIAIPSLNLAVVNFASSNFTRVNSDSDADPQTDKDRPR